MVPSKRQRRAQQSRSSGGRFASASGVQRSEGLLSENESEFGDSEDQSEEQAIILPKKTIGIATTLHPAKYCGNSKRSNERYLQKIRALEKAGGSCRSLFDFGMTSAQLPRFVCSCQQH